MPHTPARIARIVRLEVCMAELLGLHEAAQRCGVSDETIRRRIKAGQLPQALQSGVHGGWQIPIAALVGAGLSPRRSGAPARAADPDLRADLRDEAAAIRSQLAVIAIERDSLRMIVEAKNDLIASLERHISDLRSGRVESAEQQ